MSLTLRLLAVMALLLPALSQARSLPDFTGLVEEQHPTVVNISTTRSNDGMSLPPGMEMPDLEGTPFGEMLKKFLEEQQRGGGGERRRGGGEHVAGGKARAGGLRGRDGGGGPPKEQGGSQAPHQKRGGVRQQCQSAGRGRGRDGRGCD